MKSEKKGNIIDFYLYGQQFENKQKKIYIPQYNYPSQLSFLDLGIFFNLTGAEDFFLISQQQRYQRFVLISSTDSVRQLYS